MSMSMMNDMQSSLLRVARADLDGAKFYLDHASDEAHINLAGYHCQQAAEKIVKSVYLEYKMELFKSHVIRDLIVRLRDAGCDAPFFDELLRLEPALSDWADKPRYLYNYTAGKDDVTKAYACLESILDGLTPPVAKEETLLNAYLNRHPADRKD